MNAEEIWNAAVERAAEEATKFYAGPLANRTDDDFMVCDYAGGNIDDAYELGRQHGENDIAETIALHIRNLKVVL